MELHSNAHIPDGLLASMTLLSEKPHQGVPSWESALHQGIDERNSTALLGLRFRCSEIVSGTVVAPNNGTPKPAPSPTPQQPAKQPWFCGTGNSWSHPFTAPTGKQWGIWSTSDLIIAASISKFTGGKDPVSQVFIDAGLLEAYGWAKCD